MKTRQGFVSNSSSSSFILDLREPGVKELVAQTECSIQELTDRTRLTCCAQGEDLVKNILEMKADHYGDLNEVLDGTWWEHGEWILDWARRLGVENIVYMRESDEEMGGILFHYTDREEIWSLGNIDKCPNAKNPYRLLAELAEEEQEYH